MYTDILIPTDGSEGVEKAVEHALEIAQEYEAILHGLYVVEIPMIRTNIEGVIYAAEEMREGLNEEGKRATQRIAEEAREAGVDVVTEVREGVPYETILSYADENDVDLIVMGTHGRSGIERLLMGSVTEKVVRASKVPVLTVSIDVSSQ